MSINEHLDDGVPLEDYIEENEDQLDLSADDVSQDTWMVSNSDEDVRVYHRKDREDLEGLEFAYDTHQQFRNELNSISTLEEERYSFYSYKDMDAADIILDEENREDRWITSHTTYSLDSKR